jgi:Pyridoxamine 5'-phosphate oxidase
VRVFDTGTLIKAPDASSWHPMGAGVSSPCAGIPGDAVSRGQDATLQLQAAAAAAARSRDGSGGSPIRTTGLRRTPLSGGVNNASSQYDLPSPVVAVRNLVRRSITFPLSAGLGTEVHHSQECCGFLLRTPANSCDWRVHAGCPGLQVEQVQFAHLCTTMSSMHHRRAGYPFGTLVDFASDGAGFPIFCMSPLAIHTRNIVEDCRCSLVVQMPGWAGLANARVTIFGDVFQLPPELQEPAREVRHQTSNCCQICKLQHMEVVYAPSLTLHTQLGDQGCS